MEVWKSFEKNVITHSAAHHLMTIYRLHTEKGYARVSDVARELEITRGSASITLKALKQKGLVVEDENRFLLLSAEGERISHAIQSMRMIVIKFLRDVLIVDEKQAEIDACKIEHLLSQETGKKLLSFMRFLSSDKPRVRAVLQDFWEHENICAEKTDFCDICDVECLMPHD